LVAQSRHLARRVAGPLARKRSGYFYAGSRAALAQLDRLAARMSASDGMDWLTVEDLAVRAPGATYRALEPRAPGVMPPPGWKWPAVFVSKARWRGAPARTQGVFEIPGGVVFGRRGQFGPDDRGLMMEGGSLWRGDERALFADAAAARAVGLEELDGVSMCMWAGPPKSFGHDLLQSVPRLELFRRAYGLDADRYLVPEHAAPPTVEALALLGVPDERMLRVPAVGSPAYRCQTLRAATSLFHSEYGASWAVEFLQELFLPELPAEQGRRLYVQRGVPRRAVLNESDVIALLEREGFETVTAGPQPMREQAALFASASVIVAPHGSALACLVFCRPGTTVIDLQSANHASDDFAFLSWRRGLDYQIILGTEPAPPPRLWTWQIDADTVADIPALRAALRTIAPR
jgi:hypothetical protein